MKENKNELVAMLRQSNREEIFFFYKVPIILIECSSQQKKMGF